MLGISNRRDRYLRTLLIHGARAALCLAPRGRERRSGWAASTRARREWNIATVALANKNERTACAVIARGVEFDAEHVRKVA